jgi:hypothetical protein
MRHDTCQKAAPSLKFTRDEIAWTVVMTRDCAWRPAALQTHSGLSEIVEVAIDSFLTCNEVSFPVRPMRL